MIADTKSMKVLSDIDVSQKRVFVRADLDVPIEKSQVKSHKSKVEELSEEAEMATRLTNLKPTVDYLVEHVASTIIIAGHIDRPQKPDPALSTKQLLPILEKIIGQK